VLVKRCQSPNSGKKIHLSHDPTRTDVRGSTNPFHISQYHHPLLASSVNFHAQRRLRRSGANAGMVNSQVDGKRRVRRRRSHSELDDEKLHKSRGKGKVALEPNGPEVRRNTIERLEDRTSNDRTAATPKMTSESHATLRSQKGSSSHRRRKDHHRSGVEKSHRSRRKSTSRDDSTYVYGNPESKSKHARITVAEKKLGSDDESSESEEAERSTQPESVKERPRKRKIKIVYITEEDYQSSKPKERTVREKKPQDGPQEREGSIRRSKTHHSRRKASAEAPPASPPRRYGTRDFLERPLLT
jgi:hypothetical protein